METLFTKWLIERGLQRSAKNYASAINNISKHYSESTGQLINIYQIQDPNVIIEIVNDYKQTGRFSEYGYEHHGRYRAAMNRYAEFFLERSNISDQDNTLVKITEEMEDIEVAGKSMTSTSNNLNNEEITSILTYERDLQTSFCMDYFRYFPDYHIFNRKLNGVEYPINGKRIDVLLENKSTKDLLIVELKSGIANFKAFGQLSMYLGMIRERFQDVLVKGLAAEFDDSIIYAARTNSDIKLMKYKINLSLEETE